jgi:hypothetical protein
MKFILITAFLAIFSFKSYSQSSPPIIDLSLENADSTSNTYTLEFGDSLDIFLKIKNNSELNLDTTEFVYFGLIGFDNYYIAAEDTTDHKKVYLRPQEHFITHGIHSENNQSLEIDELIELCFYLKMPANYNLYSDTVLSNDTVCIQLVLKADPNYTSIKDDVATTQFYKIYPNPASDILYIDFDANTILQSNIQIVNVLGKVVYEVIQDKDANHNIIDISHLPSGIYQIKMLIGNIHISEKFIKH